MNRIDKSIGLGKANLVALVLALPLFIVTLPPYLMLWGYESLSLGADNLFGSFFVFLGAFFGGIIVHELLHGLTWQVLSGKWGSVEYGVKWQMLTPYAHLKTRIQAGAYRVGVWMPGLIVGVLPLLMGLLLGNGTLFWFGIIFTWAAGGDAIILWLLRDVPDDATVEDHPERAGCYVYLPETT